MRALDVKKGLRADMTFQLGQPFRPFQQLMGVLPDRSKRIVPKPYHILMTDVDSPIIDFYPRDFDLDMNGKKMDWEAVVKIPFIDERRLLTAMKPKDLLLSAEEKQRNEFGVTLKFTFSSDVDFTYPSSLSGIFPDITHCRCVENIFELPTMEGLSLHIGLMNGVKLGQNALAGFPSLQTLPHSANLDFHGVSVFQQESRNESMVVTILDSEKRGNVELAKSQLGRRIHVGYPFLSEARVVRVSDELFNYYHPESGDGPPVAIPHGPPEISLWRRKAERIEGTYSKRLGILIGQVESMVHVEMLKGLKKTDDGSTVKEYAEVPGIETDYASQLVVPEVVNEDSRFIEKAALPIEEEFPVGTRAFFLGEFNYGRPLEVVGHSSNRADIWVSTIRGKVPEFGREIAKDADRLSPYTPSFAVAKMLQLNPLVLSKITSSFQVLLDDSRLNLGLNLKFEAKKLKVLGYSRRGSTGWEFSQKAIELIQQYMILFPDFIAGIMRNPQGNIYEATDFYPAAEAKAKIKEIQVWLKSIESKSFEKVPLDAAQLDSDIIHRIEAAADEAALKNPPEMNQYKKIKSVPRNALLKPSDAESRLGHQTFDLGDRIVYAQDSGRVPIASHGTVVGITRTPRTTYLDVVFDATFMSGTSLDNRCSPFRGSTIPVHSVLNVTDRQLVAGSRAAESHRFLSTSEPPRIGFDGTTLSGSTGKGSRTQSPIPPPTNGSWRENGIGHQTGHRDLPWGRGREANIADQTTSRQSLNFQGPAAGQNLGFGGRGGQANGIPGRGRGNSNSPRSSPKIIDQGDFDSDASRNGRPAQARSYSNVPPPPSLDAGTRGRGWGGMRSGRGRGEVARGRGRGATFS